MRLCRYNDESGTGSENYAVSRKGLNSHSNRTKALTLVGPQEKFGSGTGILQRWRRVPNRRQRTSATLPA